MPAWMILTNIGSKCVLVLLLGLSVWSISIMIDRARVFEALGADLRFWKKWKRQAPVTHRQDPTKWIETRDWKNLSDWAYQNKDLRAGTIRALLESGRGDDQIDQTTKIDRAVKSFLSTEKVQLEKGLTVLATLGSNAPFVGLFGTVLGIIQAFGMLSSASGGASGTVTSGIAEALIATAVGLFVAIPAVVAYNVFTRQLKLFLTECETIRDLYLSRFDSKQHNATVANPRQVSP